MCSANKELYEFDKFRLDVCERFLLKNGKRVSLADRAFDTLCALVRHDNRLVGKDELMTEVWAETIVEENNLDKNISYLRQVLGERRKGKQKYIETVRGHGYRFVAEVRRVEVTDLPADSRLNQKQTHQLTTSGNNHFADRNGEIFSASPAAPAVENKTSSEITKQCRRCRRIYADKTLNFCLDDGTPLLENSSSDSPTLTFQSRPTNESPKVTFSAQTPSIAVLSFVNLSNDAGNEYFCDGLAEELLNALAKIDDLKVAARTSTFSFKNKNVSIADIGQALNVNTVLEGGVQKIGDRLRITVQLIKVADGYHLWSERYDRQMTDIFDLQDEITLAVVEALKIKLLTEEKSAVMKRYTDNAAAYQLYLKGRFFWNERKPESFQKAIGYFRQAIESDSNYALAYSGLADCYSILGFYELLPPQEAGRKAKAAILKALEIDDSLGEAHTSLGVFKAIYEWDWAGSEQAFRRAFRLNPNYAVAHLWFGVIITSFGRFDEALSEVGTAQELDPLSPIVNAYAGWMLYFARRYDEAIVQSRKAIEIAPEHFLGHWTLGVIYAQKQMYEEAIAELKKAGNFDAGLARVYGQAGQRAAAEKVLKELKKKSKQCYVSPIAMAVVYVGLGEKEKIFPLLEKAFAEHSTRLQWFMVDPTNVDRLGSDARFTGLLRRMKLIPETESQHT